MNTRYYIKYVRNEYGNLTRVVPTKEILSDTGEVLAEVQVSTIEFSESVGSESIAPFFSEAALSVTAEATKALAYDPESTLATKGISAPPYGSMLGEALATLLEIGAYLVSRKTI